MANKTLIESKSLQSNFSKPFITENNEILRENLKNISSDRQYSEDNYLENISLGSSVKFEVPNDEFLENKIIQQVEYLFSDANITGEKFLLKHIARNKEGYVSLKLISSLRKVKALSKDWRVVADSLKKSQRLTMNAEMTKIKRLDPLPCARTVLVFNYLSNGFGFEELKTRLETLGTVVSVVNVQSKAHVKNVNVKKTLVAYEKIATYPFAIVKFEKPEQSINAVLYPSYPSSVGKVVPLIEDLNDTSISSPNRGKNRCLKNAESSSIFDDKKENRQSAVVPKEENKPSFIHTPHTYKDGWWSGKWAQRKNATDKGVPSTSKKPFVVILRLPKGPDGTKGFRRNVDVAPVYVAFSVPSASRRASFSKVSTMLECTKLN